MFKCSLGKLGTLYFNQKLMNIDLNFDEFSGVVEFFIREFEIMGIRFEFLDAGNGDCIWITTDEGINILIDGGFGYTYDKKLASAEKKRIDEEKPERVDIKTKIENLEDNQKLDLVVLTHYDSDHISGLSKLIEKESKKKSDTVIKELWFNAFENATFPIENKEEHNQSFTNQMKHQTSEKQQKKFEEFIEDIKDYTEYNSLMSIDKIKEPVEKENIVLLSPYTNKSYESIKDIRITLLSPNNDKLNDLKEKYDKKFQTTDIDKKYDWDNSTDTLLEEIKLKEESRNPKRFLDTAEANGSSIAFILEYKNEKKYLFLADAHIDLIVNSLQKLGYDNDNPLVVDFVKLSHHGSRENINNEFLSLIKSKQFIILANGSEAYWHPDKETLVRIIDYYKDNSEKISFIFNHEVNDIFYNHEEILGDNFELFKDNEFKNNDISSDDFELIYKNTLGVLDG